MRRIILLGWIALSPAGLAFAAGPDNALAILNAGLSEAAQNDPRWRTDIRAEPGGSTAPPGAPPGRVFARSPILGRYSYRPTTYAELQPDERLRWLRSRAFRSFLASRFPRPRRRLRFALPPEEMLRSRPFLLNLPPP